ncbi:MAG: alginate lyase family protein [Candidatus Cloacimonetes bacterium]|nr:alginate lyase family protein [Candidatus Cloacimonadota bacterium]
MKLLKVWQMIRSLITEYRIPWTLFRIGYSFKLKLLKLIPITERFFEHKVDIKRIDIFRLGIEEISSVLQSLSEADKQTLITEADDATRGIIKGFSSIKLNYGYPINWHLNPLTDAIERSDRKWYRIPDFDERRGDIKVIWEASRFSHFLTLARAFILTGEIRYYQAFSDQLSDWIKQNPYSFGANYKCGQESALRMINTLLAYSVFSQAGIASRQDFHYVVELVQGSYKKILSNFYYARRCIKNNHTLSELIGLIIGAWCSKNPRRLKKAFYLLDREIQEQFSNDGGYRQFSFNYQRFALQLMECLHMLSLTVGNQITEEAKRKIISSAQLMYQCMNDDGDIPNYGSNDGALIFPLTSCSYRDFRPVVNTIASLYAKKSYFSPGSYDEECAWFGAESNSPKTTERQSSAFPEAGLFTLKNTDIFVLVSLNAYKYRPGHMDQLHTDIWYKGKNIFCDSGSYSYASDLGKTLSSTDAHNTVKVKGREQMNKHGNFLVTDWAKRIEYNHARDRFAGSYRSKNGYIHSREVILNTSTIIINDVVEGAEEYSILFHTPYSVTKESEKIMIKEDERVLCTLSTDCEVRIEESYRSLYYLQSEKISCIELVSQSPSHRLEINFSGA